MVYLYLFQCVLIISMCQTKQLWCSYYCNISPSIIKKIDFLKGLEPITWG